MKYFYLGDQTVNYINEVVSYSPGEFDSVTPFSSNGIAITQKITESEIQIPPEVTESEIQIPPEVIESEIQIPLEVYEGLSRQIQDKPKILNTKMELDELSRTILMKANSLVTNAFRTAKLLSVENLHSLSPELINQIKENSIRL
ncbi:MAG: hypothetical protein RLZZ156_1758, partial [Deinococcota bacterium]